MGDHADDMLDADMLEDALHRADYAYENLENHIWVTRDGKELHVTKMDTSHVKNALNMLKRNGSVGPSDIEFLLTCGMPNGEMAQMAVEQEMDRVFEMDIDPWVDILRDELKRRGQNETDK